VTRRTAFITGGGGAIAEQIALRLDARGHDLVLADGSRGRRR
jgi:NAD(P)-dependent dehydrogenase (short-subunit alcohol dehydrogenase family)